MSEGRKSLGGLENLRNHPVAQGVQERSTETPKNGASEGEESVEGWSELQSEITNTLAEEGWDPQVVEYFLSIHDAPNLFEKAKTDDDVAGALQQLLYRIKEETLPVIHREQAAFDQELSASEAVELKETLEKEMVASVAMVELLARKAGIDVDAKHRNLLNVPNSEFEGLGSFYERYYKLKRELKKILADFAIKPAELKRITEKRKQMLNAFHKVRSVAAERGISLEALQSEDDLTKDMEQPPKKHEETGEKTPEKLETDKTWERLKPDIVAHLAKKGVPREWSEDRLNFIEKLGAHKSTDVVGSLIENLLSDYSQEQAIDGSFESGDHERQIETQERETQDKNAKEVNIDAVEQPVVDAAWERTRAATIKYLEGEGVDGAFAEERMKKAEGRGGPLNEEEVAIFVKNILHEYKQDQQEKVLTADHMKSTLNALLKSMPSVGFMTNLDDPITIERVRELMHNRMKDQGFDDVTLIDQLLDEELEKRKSIEALLPTVGEYAVVVKRVIKEGENSLVLQGEKETGEVLSEIKIGQPLRIGRLETSIVQNISVENNGLIIETETSTYSLKKTEAPVKEEEKDVVMSNNDAIEEEGNLIDADEGYRENMEGEIDALSTDMLERVRDGAEIQFSQEYQKFQQAVSELKNLLAEQKENLNATYGVQSFSDEQKAKIDAKYVEIKNLAGEIAEDYLNPKKEEDTSLEKSEVSTNERVDQKVETRTEEDVMPEKKYPERVALRNTWREAEEAYSIALEANENKSRLRKIFGIKPKGQEKRLSTLYKEMMASRKAYAVTLETALMDRISNKNKKSNRVENSWASIDGLKQKRNVRIALADRFVLRPAQEHIALQEKTRLTPDRRMILSKLRQHFPHSNVLANVGAGAIAEWASFDSTKLEQYVPKNNRSIKHLRNVAEVRKVLSLFDQNDPLWTPSARNINEISIPQTGNESNRSTLPDAKQGIPRTQEGLSALLADIEALKKLAEAGNEQAKKKYIEIKALLNSQK